MPPFRLATDMKPAGDQPTAIAQLVDGLRDGVPQQVLLGARRVAVPGGPGLGASGLLYSPGAAASSGAARCMR